MDRQELVLAVLAAGDGAVHTPVHLQKLFFLLDDRMPDKIGGPRFSFRPYHYGPFDGAVYDEVKSLESKGLVEIARQADSRIRYCRLTPEGQEQGEPLLGELGAQASSYIRRLSEWVRAQTFAGLVSAVYAAYPDMKINSVFQGYG